MAGHIRYISRRDNGVYYYQRRVPKAVTDDSQALRTYFGGQALFRRSLKTRKQSDAMTRGVATHSWFEAQLRLADGRMVEADITNEGIRPLTPELLRKLSIQTRDRTVDKWVKQVVLAEKGEEFHEELERMIYQRELDAPEHRAALQSYGENISPRWPNVTELVQSAIARERIYAPEGSDAWSLIARAIRDGLNIGEKDVDAILDGKMPAIPSASPKRLSAPKISAAVDDYVAQKSAGRTVREVRGALKSFVNTVGDLPLDEITRADFIRFCEVEGQKTVGGNSRESIVRPLSAATLQKKVRLLHSAIERAIKLGSFVGPNPASKIDAALFTKPAPKSLMPDKRPFSVHELNLIFQHPWFTGCKSANQIHSEGTFRLQGMHYWAPILALYTGCRAGELAGLLVREVRLDHQHPHLVIQDNQYRTTKGSYRRNVPILDALVELGFADFFEKVARAGHERLFWDWEPPKSRGVAGAPAWSNGKLVRSFNRIVVRRSLQAELNPAARKEVTFHSFRGAFKTLLGRAEYGLPTNYIHEVIGHAKSSLDQRYVREIPIEDTYPAVRSCRYLDLQLPLPPCQRR